jgi:hypothetical protein
MRMCPPMCGSVTHLVLTLSIFLGLHTSHVVAQSNSEPSARFQLTLQNATHASVTVEFFCDNSPCSVNGFDPASSLDLLGWVYEWGVRTITASSAFEVPLRFTAPYSTMQVRPDALGLELSFHPGKHETCWCTRVPIL